MFSHIMIGTNDLAKAKTFYDAVLGTIDVKPGRIDADRRIFWRTPTGTFCVTKPIDGAPATFAQSGTKGRLRKPTALATSLKRRLTPAAVVTRCVWLASSQATETTRSPNCRCGVSPKWRAAARI